jgi:hypothetical protein
MFPENFCTHTSEFEKEVRNDVLQKKFIKPFWIVALALC